MRIILLILIVFGCFAEEVVPLIEKEGKERFFQSEYKDAYWPLSQHYETQKKRYCGVASAVMVLNALEVPRPQIWPGSISRLYTQDNFFDVCKSVDKNLVDTRGVTLGELAQALEDCGVGVEIVYEVNVDSFRELLKKHLVETDRFIITNYSRDVVQKKGGGHISPIAAYDQISDSVLILDVFRCRYTGTWVSLPLLVSAMQTIDNDSGMFRGLIIVQRQ